MKNLTVVIIILLMVSCNNNLVQSDYFDKICTNSSGFKIDTTRESATYYTKGTNDYLALRRISVPSDTFFFRIECTVDTTLQIFEYSFYKAKSAYKIYRFPLGLRGKILFDKDHDDIKNFVTIFDSTKKGEGFISQLETNGILKLPESYDIPGYPRDEYSKIFLIEYSNKCRYNILAFDNPYQNSKNFKEAQSLVNFLEF